MGLYDIMDEIAARQVTKSETGDNRILGVLTGIGRGLRCRPAEPPGDITFFLRWETRCFWYLSRGI